jgi:hypothetical protein
MFKNNPRAVAAEVVNAGKCNLNCAYCYIPKTAEMDTMHDEIVDYLDSGKFIDDLVTAYGDQLTSISPWGTEPTLTLDIFSKWMPELLKTFPNLSNVNFSTNMLRNPKYLFGFLEALPKDRKFHWSVQYSLDGPAYINDATRMKNATNRIMANVKEFMAEASRQDLGELEVVMNCKSTWDETIIEMVGQDLDKVRDYLDFFNMFYGELDAVLTGSHVMHGKVNAPFLALPGRFTTQHGKWWGDITRELLRLQVGHEVHNLYPHLSGEFCAYRPRLHRILDHGIEYYVNTAHTTCSAGDSQYALDHKSQIHACHRSFYLNDDNYVQSVEADPDRVNWHAVQYENDRLPDVRKFMMVDVADDLGGRRNAYTNASYHQFARGRVALAKGLIKLLANAGQINRLYHSDKIATFFAEFLISAFSCPVEYQLTLGNPNLFPASVIKVCGNGMFEILMMYTTDSGTRRKHEWYK